MDGLGGRGQFRVGWVGDGDGGRRGTYVELVVVAAEAVEEEVSVDLEGKGQHGLVEGWIHLASRA